MFAPPITYDLARFNTRKFSTAKAHVPPGGLGCFYAEYSPRSSMMKVMVKVAARFFNTQGGEVPLDIKTSFMNAFKTEVPKVWNNKFRFTLTKAGFGGLRVTPQFEVVEAPIDEAHYDLKIVNNRQGNICVRTGEDPSLKVLKDRKWDPYRGKLSAQFHLGAADAAELTQAKNIIEAMGKAVEIEYVLPTSTQVGAGYSMVAMERLRTLARDVNAVFENYGEAPKLTITGPGNKGTDVAKNVGGILTRFGMKADLKYAKSPVVGKVRMSLDTKQLEKLKTKVLADVTAFPQFAQKAIVHEYGHMLGLPDEYMCVSAGAVGIVGVLGLGSGSTQESEVLEGNTTTNQQDLTAGIEKSQVEFIKLCQAFGVPAPPFGRSNPNIMSSGLQIQMCHGVTVAHALWRMTRHYTNQSDWRIDVT